MAPKLSFNCLEAETMVNLIMVPMPGHNANAKAHVNAMAMSDDSAVQCLTLKTVVYLSFRYCEHSS